MLKNIQKTPKPQNPKLPKSINKNFIINSEKWTNSDITKPDITRSPNRCNTNTRTTWYSRTNTISLPMRSQRQRLPKETINLPCSMIKQLPSRSPVSNHPRTPLRISQRWWTIASSDLSIRLKYSRILDLEIKCRWVKPLNQPIWLRNNSTCLAIEACSNRESRSCNNNKCSSSTNGSNSSNSRS